MFFSPKKKNPKHKGVCASMYTFSAHTTLIHIKHNKLMKVPLTLSNLSKIFFFLNEINGPFM